MKRLLRAALPLLMAWGLAGCGAADSGPRPSFVLFVIDTLRADAVSAYGSVEGTTPTLDGLADRGLLFTEARAHAPWTLPSHASLFTGLLPGQHGLGWRRTVAPDALLMLAERMRDAGWETFGYSENVWISDSFGMAQGFDTFWFQGLSGRKAPPLERALSDWVASRDASRPFFAFVNVVDPHWPYDAQDRSAWLPSDATPAEVARIEAAPDACVDYSPRERALLDALYRADVRAGDAKLADAIGQLEGAGDEPLVWIVTSDHGELLGDEGLRDHQFSLAEPLLRVPLVVAGLDPVTPARIAAPVRHVDVVPSILSWAGLPAAPGLAGRPLPTQAELAESRVHVAEYRDPATSAGAGLGGAAERIRDRVLRMRAPCPAGAPVYGDVRAVVRDGLKLTLRTDRPAQLHDLGADPLEREDLAEMRPGPLAELSAILAESLVSPGVPGGSLPRTADDDALLENLRALGYAE